MYWTDTKVNQTTIYKAFINGTGVKELVTTGLGTPGELTFLPVLSSVAYYLIEIMCISAEGVAWDWVNQRLYWTDTSKQVIEVLDTRADQRTTILFTGNVSIPRGLEIDPATRLEVSTFK